MYPVSQRFLQAAISGDQQVITRLDIRNNGTLLTPPDGYPNATAWSVSVDETALVRRTLSLTIGGDDDIPSAPGDLFHPVSGNEIYPWRGFRYDDGTEELAPLGVFRMSTPNPTDDGTNVGMTVKGLDRSSVLSQIGWQFPWVTNEGTNLADAIQQGIEDIWPTSLQPLVFSFAPTTFAVALTTWGASPSSSNNPWQDFVNMAATGGMELFFGPAGDVIMRPIGNPAALSPVATFEEGVTCTMTNLSKTIDETQEHNGVVYIGNASGQTPVQVTVFDNDPESDTYWLGPWGERPAFYTTANIPQAGQSSADAEAQLTVAATAQLQLILGALDEVDFDFVPNAALEEGDCVTLKRSRLKVDGNFVLSKMTIPGDVGSVESATMRPAVEVTT